MSICYTAPMHSWLLFSLTAPIFWGCANVLDSAVRRHFIKHNTAMTWLLAITRLPLALIFFLIGGFTIPDFLSLLGMLATGALWLVPFLLYYRAIEFEEPTRIALFLQTIPLTTLIIAWLTIGESLTGNQWIAFLLLMAGGLLATLKHVGGRWHMSKAILLITGANIMWAASDVFFKKFAPAFGNFSTAFAYDLLGGFLLGVVILIFKKGRVLASTHFRNLSKRTWCFLTVDLSVGFVGSIAFGYALTLGKASLTAVILAIQPLTAFFFSVILSKYVPEVSPEDSRPRVLLLKGLSFLLILVGLLALQK